jgi:hypothetical protein
LFAPAVVLPGSDFYPLALVLVPATLGMTALRSAAVQARPAAGGAPLVSAARR